MADNPFEEKGAANPFAEPGARGGARGGEDLHNPFEKPAAAPPSPAASVPADGSAYESAPAPTSTFGAYDTGAYGGSSGAYAAPPASAAPSAFNVRPRPARVSPERERPRPSARKSHVFAAHAPFERRSFASNSGARFFSRFVRAFSPFEATSRADLTRTASREP